MQKFLNFLFGHFSVDTQFRLGLNSLAKRKISSDAGRAASKERFFLSASNFIESLGKAYLYHVWIMFLKELDNFEKELSISLPF